MTPGRYYITFCVLAIVLAACDPGIGVVIRNESSQDKYIQVKYPASMRDLYTNRPQYVDTIMTYTDEPKSGKFTPMLSSDTIARTYSFNLKAGEYAIVESRWPATQPTFGQVFIIGNTDTVNLKPRSKLFKRKRFFFVGGTWTYVIKQE